MPPTYHYRGPAQAALDLVERLKARWDELDIEQQKQIAAVLIAFWDEISRDLWSDSQRTETVEEFLAQAGAEPLISELAPDILAAAEEAGAAGRTVSLTDQEALRRALDNFPAPGTSAQPPRQFRHPSTTLLAVLDWLRAYWSELRPEVQAAVGQHQTAFQAQLQAARSQETRDTAINTFLAGLGDLPQVGELLRDTLDADRMPYEKRITDTVWRSASFFERGAGDASYLAPWPKDSGGETESLAPLFDSQQVNQAVTRFYPDVEFPAQVALSDERVPLVVRLVTTPAEQTALDSLSQMLVSFAEPGQPEVITVVLNAEGFEETTGDLSRTILVFAQRDSQPAVFLLKPQAAGRRRIVVNFYHQDRLLGTAALESEVLQAQPQRRQPARLGLPLVIEGIPSSPPPPVDLQLRVTLGADRRRIFYMLHSPKAAVGYHWQAAGSVTLADEPRFYLERTFERLSRMAATRPDKRSPEDDRRYRQTLEEIGQNLYQELFSPELKTEYRRIRDLRQRDVIQSLLITSDEPWIPWELVKPYEFDDDTGEELFDDSFLCQEFRLSRWLAGRGVPDAVHVRAASLVAPDGNLPYVQREREYFAQLPDRWPLTVDALLDSTDQVLLALRAARINLYHFACHGNFDSENPDESVLLLKDGPFSPQQIIGPSQAGVRKSRPLVFLNACHSGQVGFALTGLGGWAERFVNAGASAFIGTLWKVSDELAAEFAVRFYDELWSGTPLGEAFHQARAHVRDLDDANPTWLAYALYADPNGLAETDY